MRVFKSALVAVSALLISGGAVLAQQRQQYDLQRTFDELDRTLDCCSHRMAQADFAIPEIPAAPNQGADDEDE